MRATLALSREMSTFVHEALAEDVVFTLLRGCCIYKSVEGGTLLYCSSDPCLYRCAPSHCGHHATQPSNAPLFTYASFVDLRVIVSPTRLV